MFCNSFARLQPRPFLFHSLALLLFGAPALAQDRFATSVLDYSPGTGSGVFVSANALGGPQGGGFFSGSFHVASLGDGGSLTLGFDVTITNGPGADFSVFENCFVSGPGVFGQMAFVEVSSDGVSFARFPNHYAGPAGPLSPFGNSPIGTWSGMTGSMPTLSNVVGNSIDPFDPVRSGGEAFDLSELDTDPLVLSGTVNTAAIHFVRVVDVFEGALDSLGSPIYDHGGSVSSADIDAVAVLNHTGNVTSDQPELDLYLDANGFLNIIFRDADGIADLDPSTLVTSFSFVQVSLASLIFAFNILVADPTEIHLRSKQSIPALGSVTSLTMSIRDLSGQFSSDQVFLQG